MASGAAFHCAYGHATQQAFLEAHELAFAFFSGVFRRLRYDNLTSAVKKILRGYRREETARFIALRSHWHFDSEFCTPAEGHEKGGVEGEAGYFRRNHWVPVPQAPDLAALNRQLLQGCHDDEQRWIAGRDQSIGAAVLIEREHLLPLLTEGLDLADTSFPAVNSMGCVKVLTNAYSVPLKAGTQVQAKAYASTVELWHDGRCVGRMSAATSATSRCSIWNIIWTCFPESRARWQDRAHWSNSAGQDFGPHRLTLSGRHSSHDTANKPAQGTWSTCLSWPGKAGATVCRKPLKQRWRPVAPIRLRFSTCFMRAT
jgi:hypothetical protein